MSDIRGDNNLEPAIRFRGFAGGWEKCRLENVVTVNSGKDYKHLNKGNIPVYGTGGYMLSVDEFLSEKDGIGIGRKGTINAPYILKAPYWTVDTLFYVIPRERQDLGFLYAVFQGINWKKYDESTGVPSLSKQTINAVETVIPDYDEQRRIGKCINHLDDLIAVNQCKGEVLQSLKKALLQKMFVSGTDIMPDIRFKGFTDAWEKRRLGQIVDVFDNLRIPVTASDRIPGSTPYYGANGIQDYVDGHTHNGEFALVAEDGANDIQDYPIQFVTGRVWVNNHAHVLAGKHGVANTRFISFSLKQVRIEPYLSGSGRAKLNAGEMVKLPVLLPSLEEQVQVGGLFQHLDDLITVNQRKGEALQSLKKALLQKMFV